MFYNPKKEIEALKEKISDLGQAQLDFFKRANQLMSDLRDDSKKQYMWELQEEEMSNIIDGKKVKKIRKILQ